MTSQTYSWIMTHSPVFISVSLPAESVGSVRCAGVCQYKRAVITVEHVDMLEYVKTTTVEHVSAHSASRCCIMRQVFSTGELILPTDML